MTAKPVAQRQREWRAARSAAGLVRLVAYVPPELRERYKRLGADAWLAMVLAMAADPDPYGRDGAAQDARAASRK